MGAHALPRAEIASGFAMWNILRRDARPLDEAVLSLTRRMANRLALTPAERAKLAALIALHEDDMSNTSAFL